MTLPRCTRTRHDSYSAWNHMRDRCHNPKHPKFKYYGGRGVTICERWDSFPLFALDMGPRPTKKHTLDRIESNGNYEPGNCRWATMFEQNQNRRNMHYIERNGKRYTLTEFAKTLGVHSSVILNRLSRGWTMEKALTTFGRKPCESA